MAKDETERLNALLAEGGAPKLTPGTYVVNGMLDVEGLFGLTVHWPGVVLLETERPRGRRRVQHFHAKFCMALTLSGFEIVGTRPDGEPYRPTWEGDHAIGLHACSGTVIEGVNAHHVYGDGVYLASVGGWKQSTPCRYTQILESRLWELGRHGIGCTSSDGLLAQGNTIGPFERLWFDKEDRVASDVRKNLRVRRDENTVIGKAA